MGRRGPSVLEASQLMNTAQICRESIRLLLFHSSHFNPIILLLSPLPISLFISRFLIHQFPWLPSSTLEPISNFFEKNGIPNILLKLLYNSIFSVVICLPSSVTFSLIGKAVTVRAVVYAYSGARLTNRRLLRASGIVWVKLLHTCIWEYLIILGLIGLLGLCLVAIPNILQAYLKCPRVLVFWVTLCLLGIPFCIAFAHAVVVGNLAKVMAVVEADCHGMESLAKAKDLIWGRRQTALLMALLSNAGLRLVEGLFEFKMHKGGIHTWEWYIMVSMYSSMLVLDTVMNVVFYFTSKPQ